MRLSLTAAFVFVLSTLTFPLVAADVTVQSTATEILKPFDYKGVRLTDSHWQKQQQDILNFYLAIPSDDYLVGFRKRAGKPAPGNELGGWYSEDRFNSFGQIVSGLSRFYAGTGDKRAKARVDELVSGFVDCIEDDGYHFYSRECNAPHYEFDKFLGGMIDAWIYCENEQARAAISPITDWAIKNLDPNPKYPQPKGKSNVEGYTLSENLYRAYLLTGDKKYKDFAQHWDYWGWWDKFEKPTPENLYTQPDGHVMSHYHAYSHVNSLSGLATGYMSTNDDRYLVRLKNAYDYLKNTQTYVTGGYGPMERITNRKFLEAALDWSHRHFETQCGSWAVLKLSKYLESLTGDGHYAGWAEQIVYNGIGGSMQMDKKGNVQYFSNYSSRGGSKININPWSCCTGTRPQAAADYTDLVYLHDDRNVYVNLFLPSKLDWVRNGSTVSLTMDTRFPADDVVRLEIKEAPGTSFSINVRRPDWLSAEAEFKVNGEAVYVSATDKNWFPMSRQWKAGDTLEFRMPMQLEWKPFNENQPFPGAVTYGPVALVWKSTVPQENPANGRTTETLVGALQREGNGLTWKFRGDDAITVLPWYAVEPREKYYMYLDPDAKQYIELSNGWHTNEAHRTGHLAGSEAKYTFDGTAVRWHWTKFDDAGIAQVKIDGREIERVDQYGPKRGVSAFTDFSGLKPGEHTLTIVTTGEKHPASKGTVVNIVRFDEQMDNADGTE